MLPEKLRGKLTALALIYDVSPRGVNPVHLVGKIKQKTNLKKEDEKVLREVCDCFDVDYDRLPGPGGD